MTERLYYTDSYLTQFEATVSNAREGGRRVYLDRTAFYPFSGGQPFDCGVIGGIPVVDVADEGDEIAHITAAPVEVSAVSCAIDWQRRFDHMQQHSGQHLLSAVLAELFGIPTVSFHLGGESSTIDVDGPSLGAEQLRAAEQRANGLVAANRPITVTFEENSAALALRKPSERQRAIRVVSIEGLDRSACGGTHVRATGEIGAVLIRRQERIRGITRIEFLCGARAVRRARADYEALSQIARLFSASVDETPGLVAGQMQALQSLEKTFRKTASELAQRKGRELYSATPLDPSGFRRVLHRQESGPLDETLRVLAQGFASESRAVFIAISRNPASILLAVSADAGIHAGETVKDLVTSAGGRGGGNATLAQGSVPSADAAENILAALHRLPA